VRCRLSLADVAGSAILRVFLFTCCLPCPPLPPNPVWSAARSAAGKPCGRRKTASVRFAPSAASRSTSAVGPAMATGLPVPPMRVPMLWRRQATHRLGCAEFLPVFTVDRESGRKYPDPAFICSAWRSATYNPRRKVGRAIAGCVSIGRKVRAPLGRMPANGWALYAARPRRRKVQQRVDRRWPRKRIRQG